jgi:phosphate starvation-inducible membrane PsiE
VVLVVVVLIVVVVLVVLAVAMVVVMVGIVIANSCQLNKQEYSKIPTLRAFFLTFQLWPMSDTFYKAGLWMRKAF